ncbi:hypothetical protein AB1Y20_006678 [Prymnesium parvum]|uniref:CBS domain-containing protein n=1 Tax=Prymnesium parvum TaxID=97485 RepID=A0AB34J2H3_PRYPA
MALLLLLAAQSSCMTASAGMGAFQRLGSFLRSPPASAARPDALGKMVANYMTPSAALITLAPDQALKKAAQVLLDAKISGAPVVENGVLVGVISRTDLLYKLAGKRSLHSAGQGPRSLRYLENTQRIRKAKADCVRDAMTDRPISVAPQATMQDAAAIMLRKKLNRLMVATDSGELLGMVTASDIVRLTLEEDEA